MATQQRLAFKATKKSCPVRKGRITVQKETSTAEGIRTVSENDEKQRQLNVLKAFDHAVEFGPSIGISRLERWERADSFNLNPPAEVKDILLLHPHDIQFTER
jgi:DNA polymerase delta subunit 4